MWISVVRYYMALFFLITLPAGILFWLVIHSLAKSLRRIGLTWAYLIVALPIILLAGMILWLRETILAIDFGTNYLLMALAVVLFALGAALYVTHGKDLTWRTRGGVPELTGSREEGLLTEGSYSRIRHPIYVESLLWILGYALLINYLAMYLAFVFMLPIIHLVVLLEERELKERFGARYEEYCRRVPRYVPRGIGGSQKAA